MELNEILTIALSDSHKFIEEMNTLLPVSDITK